MRFDLITIFPEFFHGPFNFGVIRRGREKGLVEIRVHDLRDFTSDRHRTVDDVPYGGGPGMVMKVEPARTAIRAAKARLPVGSRSVYLAADGE